MPLTTDMDPKDHRELEKVVHTFNPRPIISSSPAVDTEKTDVKRKNLEKLIIDMCCGTGL